MKTRLEKAIALIPAWLKKRGGIITRENQEQIKSTMINQLIQARENGGICSANVFSLVLFMQKRFRNSFTVSEYIQIIKSINI